MLDNWVVLSINFSRMADKKNHFFGRLLFIIVIALLIMVYTLLIFNKIFVKFSSRWFLYVILILLIISLYPLISSIKKSINKIINKIVEIKKKKRIRKTLEKGKKEGEKEEKKREVLKKETKKPNILLRLFKKEIIKKEGKIPVVKKEEKKISFKKPKIEKKELGIISHFILFLLLIIIFFISYFYKNMLFMILALILMGLSLFAYKKLKTKKPEEFRKREKEKKPNIFSRLLSNIKIKKKIKEDIKKEEKKEERSKEKIPIVKELPSSLKIELGKYETNIDALYKIIEKEGRIKLSAISKYFGIDKRKAEEWATILQEHNLAEIHYPAIGEPELRKCQK